MCRLTGVHDAAATGDAADRSGRVPMPARRRAAACAVHTPHATNHKACAARGLSSATHSAARTACARSRRPAVCRMSCDRPSTSSARRSLLSLISSPPVRAPAPGHSAHRQVCLHNRLAHPERSSAAGVATQVDFSTGDVRLDAGTTKNKKPRVIKMTDDLRALLAGQHVEHERVKKAGHICPFVFFREVADDGAARDNSTSESLHEVMEDCLSGGGLSWAHSARLAAHGRA